MKLALSPSQTVRRTLFIHLGQFLDSRKSQFESSTKYLYSLIRDFLNNCRGDYSPDFPRVIDPIYEFVVSYSNSIVSNSILTLYCDSFQESNLELLDKPNEPLNSLHLEEGNSKFLGNRIEKMRINGQNSSLNLFGNMIQKFHPISLTSIITTMLLETQQ
jgi:hypothetical protein